MSLALRMYRLAAAAVAAGVVALAAGCSTASGTAAADNGSGRQIVVATVTETLAPANATFQQWQVTQLQGIENALHQATGK